MTLNYWVVVERYPFPNIVVSGLIPACEIISTLDGKLTKWSKRLMCSKKEDDIVKR
jgi:hypothetical protein